jgi:hypothetical protein
MASLAALPGSQHTGSHGFRVKCRAGHFYGVAWLNYFPHFFTLLDLETGLPVKDKNGLIDDLPEEPISWQPRILR